MKTRILIPACSLMAGTLLSAQSISVNLASNQSGSTIDEATKISGAVPLAGNLWNNAPDASGDLFDLIDSTGATTTASLTWSSNNTWQSASPGATDTSENGDLTKGYLDDGGPGWKVSLSSPYFLNDIYIISATDQGDPATLTAVSVNGTYYKGNEAGGTVLASGSGDTWSAANFSTADTLIESTNYLMIPAQPSVELSAARTSARAAIAGVQIVNAYSGSLSYWDTNGSTPGSGNAGGAWGSNNWTNSASGETATGAWTPGSTAVFSAGDDAFDSNAVTLSGTQTADAVWVQNGEIVLNGGTLDISAGLGILRGTDFEIFDGLVLNSKLIAADLTTVGNVTLNNASDSVTGTATLGGYVILGANHTFTKIAGAGIIDMGDTTLTLGDATDSSFGGSLSGSLDAEVIKVGTGTVSIADASEGFLGTATVNEGTLAIGSGNYYWPTSGAGNFAKSPGAQLNVLGDITTSGSLTVMGGILQVGNVGTEGSIGNPANLNLDGGGLALRYRLSGVNATLDGSAVSFAQGNTELRQHGGTETDQLLITNSTLSGSESDADGNAVNGILGAEGGDLILGTGSTTTLGEARLRNGNLIVEDGAAATFRYLNIGGGGGATGILTQTGGSVTMEAGKAGIRIGHWSGAGRAYNISGGLLDATALANNGGAARYISLGWDGEGDMEVGGGAGSATVMAPGLQFDRNRADLGSSSSTLTLLENGLVEVGDLGTVGQGTDDGIVMSGGTLRGTADANWAALLDAGSGTTSSVDVAANVTVNQTNSINGDGNLTKTGAGALALSGLPGTYSGATQVAAGSLLLNSDASGISAITVGSGASIGAGTAAATGSGTAEILTLASGSTSTMRIGTTHDMVSVFAEDGLSVTNHTITAAPISAITTGDQFPVFEYFGAIQGQGFGGFSLAVFPNPHYNLELVDNSANSTVDIKVASVTDVEWTGSSSTAWNLTTPNWSADGSASDFYSADLANFNDLGESVSVVVDASGGAIEPAETLFNNTTATTYTLSGDSISGVGGLTKTADGTLIVTNENTYTGLTSILDGTLQIGDGGTTGSVAGEIDLAAETELVFDRSDTATHAGKITGAGSLRKVGLNTLVLDNDDNTFSGGLIVEEGRVDLAGPFLWGAGGYPQGTGPVLVESGAILANMVTHAYGGSGIPASDMTLELNAQFQSVEGTYVRDITMTGASINSGSGTGNITCSYWGGTDINVLASPTQSVISSSINSVNGVNTFNVEDEASLTDDFLVSGTISGAATYNKVGLGRMLVSGTNTHTGPLNVNEGTFALGATGSMASALINVATGATLDVTAYNPGSYGLTVDQTLAGNGTVDGNVVVSGGVAPGASAGSLTVTGELDFAPGSVYNWEISDWTGTAGTGFDTLVVDSIDFSSTALNRFTVLIQEDAMVNFTEGNASFVIASTANGITNFSIATTVVDNTAFTGLGTWEMMVSGNDLVLQYTGSDNDYDSWAVDNGYWVPGAPNTAPGDDYDNDGVSNEDEYAFGLNPTDPSSVNPITVPFDPTLGTFTYTRRDTADSGWSYDIETSLNLADWPVDGGATQEVVSTVDGVQTVNVKVSDALLANPALFVRANGNAPE